jgi:hypothetical protein
MNWVKDENYRRELVLRGETFANVFMSYRRNFRESAPAARPAAAPAAVLQTTPVLEPLTTPTPLLDAVNIDEEAYEIKNQDLTMM